ncbi:hypothetical protein ACHQM5_025377 [Ranunculus cassubicifolius]
MPHHKQFHEYPTAKRAPRKKKKKKKTTVETSEDKSVPDIVSSSAVETSDGSKKIRKTRKKAVPSATGSTEIKKKPGRRKKTVEDIKDQESDAEDSDLAWPTMSEYEKEEDVEVPQQEEDISFTYSWPPLVCCFGAAQHAFVPSGRPANRLIDHEIHRMRKDELWSPTKFVRAPGSSPSSVAIALATLGGRVAFMGKLGDDHYGQTMLYYLNVNNVQTRSISIDIQKPTAVSHMKIIRKGRLRTTCVRPCAEDSFLRSEIKIDVLKEVKILIINFITDSNTRGYTPFTCDMSASGDGVVAALMRMLAVQPHLITDKKYLERTIKYAIDCGVIDQWLQGRTRGFPPHEDAEEQLVSDPNGIRSITEKEYRTLEPVS